METNPTEAQAPAAPASLAATASTETWQAQWAAYRAEQTAATQRLRAQVRASLHASGITRVEARYDGYGDSGNVEEVTLHPESVTLTAEQDTALRDMLWSVAYNLHPGFENNEGGDGEIAWDLEADKMTVEHRDRYIDYNSFSHEDV